MGTPGWGSGGTPWVVGTRGGSQALTPGRVGNRGCQDAAGGSQLVGGANPGPSGTSYHGLARFPTSAAALPGALSPEPVQPSLRSITYYEPSRSIPETFVWIPGYVRN